MAALLELHDVHVNYGAIAALKGVDLNVHAGEIVTVIGANGAGKTTLLMTISGIVRVNKGAVMFEGRPIQKMSPQEIVRLGVIQVPEGRKIFPKLTVRENLEMGGFNRRIDDKFRDDLEYVFSLFPVLKERAGQLGGTLSGGEQQMLAIGRGLMARPRALLLDEPSLGLAPVFVAKIFEVIRALNARGVTILLVEQNARMALKTANRGYVIETGTVAFSGSAQQLLDDERVKQAYLGM